jgi:cob(I)alamin adenosyltransferase
MKNNIYPGLIQVYTGDSKGKTTAALGQAFRAIGHGFHVGMVQFLKGATYTGEIYAAERLFPYFQIYSYGRGCTKAAMIKSGDAQCDACMECFVMPGNIRESDRDTVKKACARVEKMFQDPWFDLVILDEISAPLNLEMVTQEELSALLAQKPDSVELILTGRTMPQWLIDRADLVTEMKMIKHPFQSGIPGRRGIEY